jgi:hypothetical protein
MRLYRLILVLTLFAWWLTTTASAATLNVSGGQLLGASDVDVNGTLYDVEFLDGTCIALFGGCDEVSDFTFQNEWDVRDASQALLDEVFIDGMDGPFDTQPELTFGCDDVLRCRVWTPYGTAYSGTRVASDIAGNSDEIYDVRVSDIWNLYPDEDLTLDTQNVFAVWTVIPEPGTGLLVGLGLVALCARGRRVH